MVLNGLKGMEAGFVVSGENAGLHILLQDRKGRGEEELVKAAAGCMGFLNFV